MNQQRHDLSHIITVIKTNFVNLDTINKEIRNYQINANELVRKLQREGKLEDYDDAMNEIDVNMSMLKTLREEIEETILRNYGIYELRKRNLIAQQCTFKRN